MLRCGSGNPATDVTLRVAASLGALLAAASQLSDVEALFPFIPLLLTEIPVEDWFLCLGVLSRQATAPAAPDAAALDSSEVVACNICGSAAYEVVYTARLDRTLQDVADRFRSSADEPLVDQLVQCSGCGLQYVSPRLSAETILNAYTEGPDEVFVSQAAARELTFSKCLDVIEAHRPGRRGRILDVGTGGGSFLYVAAQRGWEVEGCEPNRWLCDWAARSYGLDVRPGTVFEQNYPAQSFDVVTLWDVLEHLPDPKKALLECRRILRPGGLLIVNYPDKGSWIARVMGRSWVFLLSAHLYYFTRPTLTRLLADCGFVVETIRPHWQWLALGYVLQRAEPQLGALAKLARRLATAVGLGRLHVPYWIGQSRAVARASGPTA